MRVKMTCVKVQLTPISTQFLATHSLIKRMLQKIEVVPSLHQVNLKNRGERSELGGGRVELEVVVRQVAI